MSSSDFGLNLIRNARNHATTLLAALTITGLLMLAPLETARAVTVENRLVTASIRDTGSGNSTPSAMSSADGRYVLFDSDAPDLIEGVSGSNLAGDVFLHDRASKITTLVSRSAASATTRGNAGSSPVAISADGEWALFFSSASDLVAGVTDRAGWDVFLYQRSSGTVSLVSRSATSPETTANGQSIPIGMSADGEWVLIESSATDLVHGVVDGNNRNDVFLYQRSTGAMTLVSRSAMTVGATANGISFARAISPDGEWVLFKSNATDLIVGVTDGNGGDDVFLYQRSTGSVSLVSRASVSATTTANSYSTPTAISPDGEWVLFESHATDLVAGFADGNQAADVFLHRRTSGLTTLVSRAVGSSTTANAASVPVALSVDGDWVLLSSGATNLVAGFTDGNGPFGEDVYLFRRTSGNMRLVSRSSGSATTSANRTSMPVALSSNGDWVLFQTLATDFAAGISDSNFSWDVFLYHSNTGAVRLVSRSADSATTTSNGGASARAVSPDGQLVLLGSIATNLVAGINDTNYAADVFVYQRDADAMSVISRMMRTSTLAAGYSGLRATSADGEWILFHSAANDLIAGQVDRNGLDDVFLYQRSTGAQSLVSRSANGELTAADGQSLSVAISGDGEWVLFTSRARDLIAGGTDTNGELDAFLYQRSTGTVSLVSRSSTSATVAANGSSVPKAISVDGEWVLFESTATNLVSGLFDANGSQSDVFLFHRSSGSVSLVSRSAASGSVTANAASLPAGMSTDGDWVVFNSHATDVAAGVTDTNNLPDAFLYRRSTGEVVLVSRSHVFANRTANLGSSAQSISADGGWVLFTSRGTDLITGVADVNGASDVFLFERNSGGLSLVSRSATSATVTGNGDSLAAAVSADGGYVLFRSQASDLVHGVTDGNSAEDVFLYRRASGATILVSRSAITATTAANGQSSPVAVSDDGEWVLLNSRATDLVAGVADNNGDWDSFLFRTSSGTASLVSRTAASAAIAGNARSFASAISADGQWVLFTSRATDVVAGVWDFPASNDVFLASIGLFRDSFEAPQGQSAVREP